MRCDNGYGMAPYYRPGIIPFFEHWLGFTGNVPELYWNIQSSEQRYKFLCKKLCSLVEYVNMMGGELNTTIEEVRQIADDLQKFAEEFAENFDEYFKQHICQWLNDNLTCLIGQAVKFVHFGLTNDGRLAIHIPTNWKFLEFYTPMDYEDQSTYGKLCIRY